MCRYLLTALMTYAIYPPTHPPHLPPQEPVHHRPCPLPLVVGVVARECRPDPKGRQKLARVPRVLRQDQGHLSACMGGQRGRMGQEAWGMVDGAWEIGNSQGNNLCYPRCLISP